MMLMIQKLLNNAVVRYAIAGGLAYAIEIAVILVLHYGTGASGTLAAGIAFWIGLPTAFFLQKIFAFKDYERELKTISKQAGAYALLVFFNYLFTLAVVAFFPDSILVFSRTLALIITTCWNFVIYRYLFNAKKRPTKKDVLQFVQNAIRLKDKRVNTILLCVPVIIFCTPLLLTGDKIVPGDPDYYLQIYEAFRRSVMDFGQFPSWNPWISGGIPLFANIQFGMVSIQAPLVLLFGAVVGMKLAIALYAIIGFYGFRKLFKDGLSAGNLKATLLAYIPIFGSFFVDRVVAGHYTFLMIAFVPWLMYFFLKRSGKSAWLWFALFYSIMVWSAPHYTTIMSAVVIAVWFLFETIRSTVIAWQKKAWKPLVAKLKADLLFFAKAGGAIAALCAYRMYFVYTFIHDFPRPEDASQEAFTGLYQALYAIWGPDQYASPPALRTHYGWVEAATYIGIGTLICLILIGIAYGFALYAKREQKDATKKLFNYPVYIIGALFVLFFILGLGDFGPLSPYRLLNHLPVFDSMRVATRWLAWAAIIALVAIAAYKGKAFKKTITVLLFLTVLELFFTGWQTMGSPYKIEVQHYRSSMASFDQQYLYRIPRPQLANNQNYLTQYPYDENLLETTQNNYGQVKAGDSLVDTRWPNTTIRCGANQDSCNIISENAVISYWSPTRIVITRTAPGPINLNINPGRGWRANGKYIFATYKVTDPKGAFIFDEPGDIITLDYAPTLSPDWFLHKIGL